MSDAATTSTEPQQAERFHRLFGADRFQSHSIESKKSETGKTYPVSVDNKVRRLTVEVWDKHLRGVEYRIGALARRKDETAKFVPLDVDDYGDDAPSIVRRAQAAKIPLLVCRTKSGGARPVLFLDHFAPVDKLREAERLLKTALQLGKETEFAHGNVWLPYGGGSECWCVKSSGAVMTSAEFLYAAEKNQLSPEAFDELLARLRKLTSAPKKEPPRKGERVEGNPDPDPKRCEAVLDALREQLRSTPAGERNNACFRLGCDAGKLVVLQWLTEEQAVEALLAGPLQDGWDDIEKTRGSLRNGVREGAKRGEQEAGELVARLLDRSLTEDAVALMFAERHRQSLRYDHDASSWYCWTEAYWQKDRVSCAFNWARNFAREVNARERKVALAKISFAGNVERAARGDERLAITQSAWDVDPLLLGTPGGTLDLRSGRLRPASPGDYITMQTAVAPSETADCPRWLQFLSEATLGDVEVIEFLKRLCGYALTGLTREHVLVFMYGPGGNGKTVFQNAIMRMLGDYAKTAEMEAFTETRSERHPTDLAMLRGARLVAAAETSDGRGWNEKRIKLLTGGDDITARFMRCDFFTYTPTHKLLIAGNHKPRLRNVGSAIQRRLLIVPFVNKPPEPDRQLESKLRDEWPGILRWAVDGCLAWQRSGLTRPKIVTITTDEYFASEDMFGQWMFDCLRRTQTANERTASKALYASLCAYYKEKEERPGTATWMHDQLLERECLRIKSNGYWVYTNVALCSHLDLDQPPPLDNPHM